MDKELLEQAAREGLTYVGIMERFGVTKWVAKYWLRKHGLTTKRPTYTRTAQTHREYNKAHYHKYKDKYKETSKKRVDKVRDYLRDYKLNNPCIKCGESHIACIDLHHIDPSTKEKNISDIVKCGRIDNLVKELAKCVTLCSNCHRKLHYELKLNADVIQNS